MSKPISNQYVLINNPRELSTLACFCDKQSLTEFRMELYVYDLTFRPLYFPVEGIKASAWIDQQFPDCSHVSIEIRSERYQRFIGRVFIDLTTSITDNTVIEQIAEQHIWNSIPNVIEFCCQLLLSAKKQQVLIIAPDMMP